ncbi:MAG: hypothetical protein HZB16_03965 [Armatimonadetes bacterium]|nr:hypothetical protein [Armatimonadota bacterium]
MDGFVFVPSRSRQAASGSAIPNAIINVYRIVGGGQPNQLLVTTQADADGFYRAAGLPLDTLLLVEAIDPFAIPGQPQHKVTAVISFQVAEERTRNVNEASTVASFQVAEERTRNVNEASTVAAGIVLSQGTGNPVSDQQVSALEALAEAQLGRPDAPDVTTDPTALAQLVANLDAQSFGSFEVYIYSSPVATATVKVNGATVGSTTTGLPGSAPAENEVHLPSVVRGQVNVTIEAPGFRVDNFVVDINPNQANSAQRVLVPLPTAGQNKPPTIVDQRTVPTRLSFAGGELVIQAIVVDSESDPVTVVAEVAPSQALGRTSTTEGGWTVPLVLGENHIYSGSVTVPGNASTANATYVVTLSAHDAAHVEAPTQAIMTFQVAGTNPPPDVPAR